MTDVATLALLFKHVRRTGSSLLQYAHDAYPWAPGGAGMGILESLRHMLRHEHRACAAIVKHLQRQHVPPPHFNPFPMEFTNFNYLAVDRLLSLLAEHQGRDIAELEADVRAVKDAEAKKFLQHLLDVKRENVEALARMAAPAAAEPPVPAAV
jgi:hypothetical protein